MENMINVVNELMMEDAARGITWMKKVYFAAAIAHQKAGHE